MGGMHGRGRRAREYETVGPEIRVYCPADPIPALRKPLPLVYDYRTLLFPEYPGVRFDNTQHTIII